MVTCRHIYALANTNNASSYTTGTFSPTSEELLVVTVAASASVAVGSPSDSQNLGWYEANNALFVSSGRKEYVYVANNKASASGMTFTFKCTEDPATGTVITVTGLTGMTRVGQAAVRQTAKTENQSVGGTPTATFSLAALTENPTIGWVANASSSPALIPPTGWTEQYDSGFLTPTTGIEYATRDSGFTGTTVTWGNTSATQFSVIIVEFNAALYNSTFASVA